MLMSHEHDRSKSWIAYSSIHGMPNLDPTVRDLNDWDVWEVPPNAKLLVLQPQPVILGLSASPVMAELGAGLVASAPA